MEEVGERAEGPEGVVMGYKGVEEGALVINVLPFSLHNTRERRKCLFAGSV